MAAKKKVTQGEEFAVSTSKKYINICIIYLFIGLCRISWVEAILFLEINGDRSGRRGIGYGHGGYGVSNSACSNSQRFAGVEFLRLVDIISVIFKGLRLMRSKFAFSAHGNRS